MELKDTIAWPVIMVYTTVFSYESYWYWEEKKSIGEKRENENHRVIFSQKKR